MAHVLAYDIAGRPAAGKVFGFLLAALACSWCSTGLSDVGVVHLTSH